MDVKAFIQQLDEARLVAAIADAETKTSGEIRVYISHRAHANTLAYARRRFHQLGITRTRHRNGVLLYLAPRARRFAIIGDRGVHEKGGDAFWPTASAELSAGFREGRFTEALCAAVRQVGDLLAAHFPAGADDRNELPNEIIR